MDIKKDCDVRESWVNAWEAGASGSDFQTTGSIKANSNEITVKDIGDFEAGHEVAISDCHIHHYGMVYNDKEPYLAKNQSLLTDEIELRGLNADKSWQTFLVNFCSTDPVTFRWMAVDSAYQTLTYKHPVIRRKWCWQGEDMSIGKEWIPLVDGVEMRFKKTDWLPGQSISFHARNRLLAKIVEIRGNTLILDKCASNDAEKVEVKHHDQCALQNALDRAIAQKKGLFIPAGRYRLNEGLWIQNASVRVEGTEHTLLDISEDNTAVFWISGGKEVVIRNLSMVGHTGFLELPANDAFANASGFAFWPTANQQMEIKGCAAANFVGTERLLFEDLKVSRMSSEAFYSHGADRYGQPPYIQAPHEGKPEITKQYTKSCIFHRCRVTDCGFNAFNNNDHAENTSILHCYVERATNFCENASRFTRIIGNYVKDGCASSTHSGGSCPSIDFKGVGITQAIITDNVFEAGTFLGGIMIGNNATQVVIANNIFIGYSKESAIFLIGGRGIVVTGNHIDLTHIEDNPDNERCGICVETSNVTIANNHIYCRGEICGKAKGINIADDAVNINIHDNIIERCDTGLITGRRIYSRETENSHFIFKHTELAVSEVDGPKTIRVKGLPSRHNDPTPYKGWILNGLEGGFSGQSVEIKEYDPATGIITLVKKSDIKTGDCLALSPSSANWQIHDNIITDCNKAIENNAIRQNGVIIKDNIIQT